MSRIGLGCPGWEAVAPRCLDQQPASRSVAGLGDIGGGLYGADAQVVSPAAALTAPAFSGWYCCPMSARSLRLRHTIRSRLQHGKHKRLGKTLASLVPYETADRYPIILQMPNDHQLDPCRAAHYRNYAARLRKLAKAEPHPGFNYQLLALAYRYEQLAESVERWKLASSERD